MPVEQKQIVRLTMHLPGGYSRVTAEIGGGVGLAGGQTHWDIPTEVIPPHLRKLGSRFIVIQTGLSGRLEAEHMTAEQIRSALSYKVLELSEEDG